LRSALPFLVFLACGRVEVEPGEGVSAPSAVPSCALPDVEQIALSAPDGFIRQFAFHGSDIVLATDGPHSGVTSTLQVVPQGGGPPTVLSECETFALDGDVAFCVHGSTLARVPLDGSTPTTLSTDLQTNVASLVAGDAHLYMSDVHTIWSIDETTGTRTVFASAPSIWLDSYDRGTVFWRSNSGGYGSPDFAINATTGTVTSSLTTATLVIGALKLTASSIYFTAYDPSAPVDPNKSSDKIYRLPRAGGDAIPIIDEVYPFSDFAVDDSSIIAVREQVGAIVFDLDGHELGKAHPTYRMDIAKLHGDYIFTVTDGSFGGWVSRNCRYPLD